MPVGCLAAIIKWTRIRIHYEKDEEGKTETGKLYPVRVKKHVIETNEGRVRDNKNRINAIFITGAMVLMCMVMAVSTYQRNRVWKTEHTLRSDCVKKSPNKAGALCSLGKALTDLGDFCNSQVYFDKAMARNPNIIRPLHNLVC